MKYSIKKIFQNIRWYLLLIFFISAAGVALMYEQQLSFDKIHNLNNQKKIVQSLMDLQTDDIELALIQYNGKSTQLLQEVDKLRLLYKYNFTEKYLLGNEKEYMQDLDTLANLIKTFNLAAGVYYSQKTKTKKQKLLAHNKLLSIYQQINNFIDRMIFKNIAYNERKFSLFKNLSLGVFFLILLATFWYRRMLDKIQEDIDFLIQVDKQQNHTIFSLEADTIALRMNRKTVTNENNPNNIDQVTGINNYRGLIHDYANKKGLKSSNFTSVTVFEIDNFSKTNRVFPQEVAQAILKKIAYTISLHEQPIDVIARTDYNQFTVVLSRATKEQTFKDADLIRESISELKFNLADKGMIKITMSGGHIIKPNNTSLEEALKQAKDLLTYAKSVGKNKIIQIKDIANKEII